MDKEINVIRSNMIFVDSLSTKAIELGTYKYPYKTLDKAFVEAFNSFYTNETYIPRVLIAIEMNSINLLNNKTLIDNIALNLTTYNKLSNIV